ncbi:ABC transporter substrate-binding protein [Desulfosediminicola ganghwensis]|uniref:ABC transporter substrate-binding protein n=1 Tax=Desulfosediminicola ganghwensis TaxID=2569540 RepID=UPI0010ACF493|nr:ABC transporter substrate-binding protein [Desulfosediminicola ganghwensis]
MLRRNAWVLVCVLFYTVAPQWSHFAATANIAETPAQTDQTIPVAAIFSRTGFAAVHNTLLIEVTKMTVDQINQRGGVLGKQLELLLLDNASTPIGSKKAALKAIELGAVAVIGAHWSSHSLAMAPTLQKAGIPMISPASTHPEVTLGRDYVFRACFMDVMQGEAMARFATSNLGLESVVILRNVDEVYCTKLADFFLYAFLNQGGEVLYDASYRGLATDFSEIISEILELQPDAVYIPGYTRDTALFMKQARKQGVKAIFLGGDGWDMLERLIADAVEGSYQTVHWHPDVPYRVNSDFKELYKENTGNELNSFTAPLAYDSVNMLATAIEKAGEADPVKIRDALATMQDFEGATGTWSFDEQGNPKGKKVIIATYRNGEIQFLDVVEPYVVPGELE